MVDREVFQAGFDLNDSPDPGSFNGTGVASNLSAATVDVMGVAYSKECYAISIAAALTLLAGIYQVLNGAVKCYRTPIVPPGDVHQPLQASV